MCGFNRIIKVIIVHDLDPKNLHRKWFFLLGVFGHYLQNDIFSQKPGSISFLPLKHTNFMKSFRKFLWAVFGENAFTNWHTDTYWPSLPLCMAFDTISSNIDEALSKVFLYYNFSQMTLLKWLTFLLASMTVTFTVLLL